MTKRFDFDAFDASLSEEHIAATLAAGPPPRGYVAGGMECVNNDGEPIPRVVPEDRANCTPSL